MPLDPQVAKEALWRRGVLSWKYNATQASMDAEFVEKSKIHDQLVVLAGRQIGKSYWLSIKAIEYALQHTNAQVKYISSSKHSIQQYLLPNFDQILEDCPENIRPVWASTKQQWRFPTTNSVIMLGGTDSKHFKKLRGQHAEFTVIDECAFMNDLATIVRSVLAPQTQTTFGKIILASSAPDTPGHDFSVFVKDARLQGSCIERTIYERIARTDEEAETHKKSLAKAIKESGGEKAPAFRREYCNDLAAVDTKRAVIPEFTNNLIHKLVKAVPRPDHCFKYTSLDLGFSDQSAAVFGYLNHETQVLVIEEEWAATRVVTTEIASAIKQIEQRLWKFERPLIRCADAMPLALEELRRAGIDFMKTRNDDPESAINEVRRLFGEERILIHPRCVRTVECIAAAVRTPNSKFKLDRHPDHGHFDLLMALVYLVRNLRRHENPVPPPRYDPLKPWIRVRTDVSDSVEQLRLAFNGRRF